MLILVSKQVRHKYSLENLAVFYSGDNLDGKCVNFFIRAESIAEMLGSGLAAFTARKKIGRK